jgi:hypothetical protein
MINAPYYVPIVVRDSARQKALALIKEGFVQATETLECGLCEVKYLFLCDSKDSGRRQAITRKHKEALHYFSAKIEESHIGGHLEDVLVLPYEMHMISSAMSLKIPNGASGRKTG